MKDLILSEARRLYGMGWAVLPLHPKSKRPKATRWTTGPRTSWQDFEKAYRAQDNIGVRTGEPSKIGENYLACIDVDVHDPKFINEAEKILKGIIGSKKLPTVLSGSGTGSKHLYFVTKEPFKMVTIVKKKGIGEICIYSSGRQMVLAGSIHPDTGQKYKWLNNLDVASDLPLIDLARFLSVTDLEEKPKTPREGKDAPFCFNVVDIEIDWLPLPDRVLRGIKKGDDVDDRSAFLMPAANALVVAGLSKDEILSVLTDPRNFISSTAKDRRGNNRQAQARWLWEYAVKKVMYERSYQGIFKADVVKDKNLSDAEITEQNKEFAEERNWRQELDKNQYGKPIGSVVNVAAILRGAIGPNIVRRNDFAYRDTYGLDTPWGGKANQILSDDDDTKIKYWLGQNFKLEPKKEAIRDALTIIACENIYDPVKNYITELKEWDGTPRIDSWLKKHFEAEGSPDYLAAVFRKWLVAMIMRAFNPGSRFPWMPIFEGAQGIGKSSFGRILVGDNYFLDWLPNLADKDSALGLQGMWCVEMGELATLRKNEVEVVKGYIVRNTDKVRPPFAKRWIESHRRCVFFGTTNKDRYLIDETGNRRFKPVKVGALDFECLIKDRDLLFSEARHLFEEKIETENSLSQLTGTARDFENKIHGQKMVEDDSSVMTEQIQNLIEKVLQGDSNFDLKKLKMSDLFEALGPLQKWPYNKRNEHFAAKALKTLDFVKKEIMGRNYWEWQKAVDDLSFL